MRQIEARRRAGSTRSDAAGGPPAGGGPAILGPAAGPPLVTDRSIAGPLALQQFQRWDADERRARQGRRPPGAADHGTLVSEGGRLYVARPARRVPRAVQPPYAAPPGAPFDPGRAGPVPATLRSPAEARSGRRGPGDRVEEMRLAVAGRITREPACRLGLTTTLAVIPAFASCFSAGA
jgi:hypothetical protein